LLLASKPSTYFQLSLSIRQIFVVIGRLELLHSTTSTSGLAWCRCWQSSCPFANHWRILLLPQWTWC